MRSALLFTLLAAVASGVLFGLLPALQVRRSLVVKACKMAAAARAAARGMAWVRNGLVVSEIAFACILLVGADC